MKKSRDIDFFYFDAAATTPCCEEVVAAMNEFTTRHFGNASSIHAMGKIAKQAVDKALNTIAAAIGCEADELTITSGATESNNIIVLGTATASENNNIIICPIDHKSTLEAAKEMENRGVEVRYMQVGRDGRIVLDHLRTLIDTQTALVSLSYVNSEIGVVQDVSSIGELLRGKSAFLHIDATQAVGKLCLNAAEFSRVDGLAISAHKIGGPKGIGALFVRRSAQIQPRPLTFGGGHFRLRSGTIPSQLIVGFGAAVDRVLRFGLEERLEASLLRRRIIVRALEESSVNFLWNSPENYAVPSIMNVSFPGVRSETVIKGLPNVCVSSGSACNANNLAPSYVLTSIGLDDDRANSAIRLSFQPEMAAAKVEQGARLLATKVSSLQSLVHWRN